VPDTPYYTLSAHADCLAVMTLCPYVSEDDASLSVDLWLFVVVDFESRKEDLVLIGCIRALASP